MRKKKLSCKTIREENARYFTRPCSHCGVVAPEKLLPCPFCGTVPVIQEHNPGWLCIACPRDTACNTCGLNVTFRAERRAEAIKAWNTRKTPVKR